MIRLSDEQRRAIELHGAADYPDECCGALLGDIVEGIKIVREVRNLTNSYEPSLEFEQVVPDHLDTQTPEDLNTRTPEALNTDDVLLPGKERRFLISSETMFRLMQEERRSGRRILGFYHSHPDHPAVPSEYDRVFFGGLSGYSFIILSVSRGEPAELTSWRFATDEQVVVAEEIVTA